MVRAVNACGNGLWSKEQEETIKQTPYAPTNLQATERTEEDDVCGIQLEWAAINDGGAAVEAIQVAANQKNEGEDKCQITWTSDADNADEGDWSEVA